MYKMLVKWHQHMPSHEQCFPEFGSVSDGALLVLEV